jgi:hypothetical protein
MGTAAPSPGTNSPTGFWCTKWDDAVNPNQGKHLPSDAAVNGGNGAPCLVKPAKLALGREGARVARVGRLQHGHAETRLALLRSLPRRTLGRTDRSRRGLHARRVRQHGRTARTCSGSARMRRLTSRATPATSASVARRSRTPRNSGYVDGLFSTTPTQHHDGDVVRDDQRPL